MDINDLQAKDVIKVVLRDPGGTGKVIPGPNDSPSWVQVYTSDSPQYNAIMSDLKKKYDSDDVDKLTEGALKLLSQCVTAVNFTYKGKNAEVGDMEEIMSNSKLGWLRDQVSGAMHNRTRFFGPASDS